MASPYAFVTLISSDSYLPGALAQVAALNDIHTEINFQTVCLVTPESVNVSSIKLLRKAFDLVVGVEILDHDNENGLKLLGRPDLKTVLTKLHIFRLTQFSKIIFLDADVLPLRSLSHLFTLPYEFSAAPDVGWPDIFNSGVLVLSPGEDKFNQINQLLKSKGSWDGGDQGILNEWRGDNWNRLSFTYNTTPTAAYTYAPAYERYGSQISAIHFIGQNKPWKSIAYRPPFATKQTSSTPSDSPQQSYNYEALVDKWYEVYDKHYRSQTIAPQSSFEIKRYSSVWDENAPPPLSTSASVTDVLGLDELKRLAIQGIAAAATSSSRPTGDGEYISMPLEGRIDLMRPREDPPKPKAEQEQTFQESTAIPVHEEYRSQQNPQGREDQRPTNVSFQFDETPATPFAQSFSPQDEQYRWQTLPTPQPTDFPPSPQFFPVALPVLTPQRLNTAATNFYASESESDLKDTVVQTHQHQGHHHEHTHHDNPHHVAHTPTHQQQPEQVPVVHEQKPFQLQSHQHRRTEHVDHHHHQEETKRPHSPPMLSWNPALEPPPNDLPASSAFPADTYFPNIWDQPPLRPHNLSGPSPQQPTSGNLFQPPPPPLIPQTLLNQGHYRNVTGEDPLGASPSPDRSKVKSVFPWENKPRVMPGRVFPDSDAPPPSLFLSPGSPSQTSTAAPSTPEQTKVTRTLPLSPLYGFPPNLTYSNAWDNVPSIQKYASRLVRPSQPAPLAPAFDEEGWKRARRKSWDERMEASSRDGDDEDNADEDEDEDDAAADTKWDDDSDKESSRTSKRNSRHGSFTNLPKAKAYRDQGVQTATREKRSFGVQADIPLPKPEKQRKHSMSSKRHWAPSSGSNLLAPAATRDITVGLDVSTSTKAVTPVADIVAPVPARTSLKTTSLTVALSPMRSPVREFIVPPPASGGGPIRTVPKAPSPPLKPTVRTSPMTHRSPAMSRRTSNESSMVSPASSVGLNSPQDFQPFGSTAKKGGRVWDPARGVELFKRGSEEVLARFLKMGSWEDDINR